MNVLCFFLLFSLFLDLTVFSDYLSEPFLLSLVHWWTEHKPKSIRFLSTKSFDKSGWVEIYNVKDFCFFSSQSGLTLLTCSAKNQRCKGRHPFKKVANFRALPELAKPPPPSIRATWSSFFRTSKRRFTRMTGKKYQWW